MKYRITHSNSVHGDEFTKKFIDMVLKEKGITPTEFLDRSFMIDVDNSDIPKLLQDVLPQPAQYHKMEAKKKRIEYHVGFPPGTLEDRFRDTIIANGGRVLKFVGHCAIVERTSGRGALKMIGRIADQIFGKSEIKRVEVDE